MATSNHLHLWEDRFFYITPAIQSGLTARSSATLLASVSGRPFTLVTLDGSVLRCTAAIVAPHVPRQLDADGCGLLSLNIDPASAAFRELSATLGNRSILPVNVAIFGRLRDQFEGALHGQIGTQQLRELSACMLQAVCGPRAQRGPLDPRVAPAFVVGNTMLQAKTFHNMPAPLCIQSCIYEGCQLPIDKGLRIETKYLLQVAQRSPVSRSSL